MSRLAKVNDAACVPGKLTRTYLPGGILKQVASFAEFSERTNN
jgi:hypothetical protein